MRVLGCWFHHSDRYDAWINAWLIWRYRIDPTLSRFRRGV
ncbi:hypothetical protein BZL30_4445 [Mycobacterium kansasii]|uniref:Uncharacterized protein n=1 Tax=Mycobacterium kansasii TaxID=1768 RepID=A0A1V3X5C6_MYCKA|nr:hypothetical protein BZL30_4445 [Mycobacterium kansasii]